jgi:hypothetical protein
LTVVADSLVQRTRKSPEERSGNLLFGKLSLAKSQPYCIFSAVWAKNPNMLGRYSFSVPDAVAKGELRPLRDPAGAE